MLYPFDAITSEIIDKITIKTFEKFKKLLLIDLLKIFFPSTIIMLEIAFTNVSTVLTVNVIAKIMIAMDKNFKLSFKRTEKNAKSGLTLLSIDTAIIPLIPIKKNNWNNYKK